MAFQEEIRRENRPRVGTTTRPRVADIGKVGRAGPCTPFMRGSLSDNRESGRWAADEYRSRVNQDLRHGVVAGLLGGALIMIFFRVYDGLLFEPLATPEFLAGELMGQEGLVGDLSVPLRALRIGVFTVLHLTVFSGLGILLLKLFRMTGARESMLGGGLYGITFCTLLFGLVLQISGTEISAAPQWPALLLANFLAGVVMGGYLDLRATLFT